MSPALLELKGICKSFGATRALRNVDLAVCAGEVHALIGENGAGKSTLMKILSGAYQADAGRIFLKGLARTIRSPLEGRRSGVAMIYQELNLAPHLTVEENLTLGAESSALGFVRRDRAALRRALELLGHAELPLSARVAALPIGLQQIVEIARALVTRADVIIMDEPTSSLSAADTARLFAVIRRLSSSGMAIIYISHFLEEVCEIADSYTVLRDGETVGTGPMRTMDVPGIIRLMVGRTVHEMFPRTRHAVGGRALCVDGLSGAKIPRQVSFALRRGEILGIAGLVGSGRSETARRLFGLERAAAGRLTVASGRGAAVRAMTPRRALRMGIDLLSENRKEEGLATGMSIAANTTLSSVGRLAGLRGGGLLSLRKERAAAEIWITRLNIRCRGADQCVRDLSGGNQQKVALARLLQQDADIVLLDEPTRGVDVGSKVEIYRLIGRLAEAGKSVIFISSYLPELLGICDTLAVMHRGRLSRVRPVAEWSAQSVMKVATSGGEIDD
jgi:ribose transport system ATP-binding protein